MFFIVIPQCLLINEELDGHILINNETILIKDYTFTINGYLFYQINKIFNENINYYIYNYNQYITFKNFNNMFKHNKYMHFSNNVITIDLDLDNINIINIKAKEITYECKKMYFNKNKEFIISNELKTLPSFEIKYDLFFLNLI